MAIYHLTAKTGSRSGGQSAAAKAAYIQREGRYGKQPDALVHAHSGHMPEWAATAADYWVAADTYERANGRLFKEVEFSLPRELGTDAQRAVATGFAQALTGEEQLPYTLAIHEGKGSNPHCHLMINERANDGIARTPARWFKRANKQQPARGGAAKSAALKPKNWLTDTREAWQAHANRALARSGHDARIDHRSLEAQREAAQQRGDDRRAEALDREPGIHVGHAAQRMEAAGVASDRGREQRERAERNERRRGLYQQSRELGQQISEQLRLMRKRMRGGLEAARNKFARWEHNTDRAQSRLRSREQDSDTSRDPRARAIRELDPSDMGKHSDANVRAAASRITAAYTFAHERGLDQAKRDHFIQQVREQTAEQVAAGQSVREVQMREVQAPEWQHDRSRDQEAER